MNRENQMLDKESDIQYRQVDMHRDFFDRALNAMNNRFYFEAIFLEYAAIEGRLEVILGVLGFPCNKDLEKEKRIKVAISDRVECLRVFRQNNPLLFRHTKLPKNFFTQKGQLRTWICRRNTFVHGIMKNADDYPNRKNESCSIAKRGLEYSRLLYNEAKRLRRLLRSHPELFLHTIKSCENYKCVANKDNVDSQT